MAIQAISSVGESIRSNDAFQAGNNLGDVAIDKFVEATGAGKHDEEFKVISNQGEVVKTSTTSEWEEEGFSQADIMRTVRLVGGATIGIAVLVIVLNEVMTIEAINDSDGPFAGVIDSLETTGVAAISLLVVGLLVAAANRIMGFFGGGGF